MAGALVGLLTLIKRSWCATRGDFVAFFAEISRPSTGKLNAAANRLYYACYQAAVHTLETKHGKTPAAYDAGATYWKHEKIYNLMGLVSENGKHKLLFKAMKDLRQEADYSQTTVAKGLLDGRRQKVIDLIDELKGSCSGHSGFGYARYSRCRALRRLSPGLRGRDRNRR